MVARNWPKRVVGAVLAAILLALSASNPVTAADRLSTGPPPGAALHPSVSAIITAYNVGITLQPGHVPACASAAPGRPADLQPCAGTAGQLISFPVRIQDDGRAVLHAVFDTEAEAGAAAADWAAADPGLILDGITGTALQIRAPPRSLAALVEDSRLTYLGPPLTGVPLGRFESEGLAGMHVPEYWQAFGRGDGVRLGILDIGFAGYRERLGSELPGRVKARSFYYSSDGSGDITGSGDPHGTACAEIVHDVAPEAELYLANAATTVDLENAVTWLIDEGVEVISHSVGWLIGPGDGTGLIIDIVQKATASGIIWVNAAGNFAQSHWAGPYRDSNLNGISEVDELGREGITLPIVPPDREVRLFLLWDRWPLSRDLALEIDLLDSQGRVVASSEEEFAGYPFALRALSYLPARHEEGMQARIRHRYGAPGETWLRVIRVDDGALSPEFRVPEGSIVVPADSPDVLSVGAFAWDDTGLESFSSYGPTRAGIRKPDVMGPNRVQSSTYRNGFTGTSASCPHVAGAVALIYSAAVRGGLFDLRWHPSDVLAILRREAVPLSGTPPEAATGWGAVRLPVERPGARRALLQAVGYESGPPRLRLTRAAEPGLRLEVFDVTGRLLGRVPDVSTTPHGVEYSPRDLPGHPLSRGIYLARDPATGASCSFYWPGR